MTRVGLLEDDIAIQEMLLLVFQDEGYSVVNYPDAEACLASLGITGTAVGAASMTPALPIDLLIADWRLSGSTTGVEVIRQMRAMPHVATLPVILTTAATFNDTEELQQLHVSLLEKPFSVDDIILLIQRLLIPDAPV